MKQRRIIIKINTKEDGGDRIRHTINHYKDRLNSHM